MSTSDSGRLAEEGSGPDFEADFSPLSNYEKRFPLHVLSDECGRPNSLWGIIQLSTQDFATPAYDFGSERRAHSATRSIGIRLGGREDLVHDSGFEVGRDDHELGRKMVGTAPG